MGDQQYQFIVTGIATDDTMTLDLATNVDFLGTTGNIDTFTGIETLTIAGASSGTHIFADGIALGATAASEKIVVTGGAAVTFSAQSTTDELDASAATGIITTTGGFAGAVNVKGGNKADVLNGSGSSDIIPVTMAPTTLTVVLVQIRLSSPKQLQPLTRSSLMAVWRRIQ